MIKWATKPRQQWSATSAVRQTQQLKALDEKTVNYSTPLEENVTSRSLKLFDLLDKNGQQKAQTFLSKPVALWTEDSIFQEMKQSVKLLKVVNDCAERGIALIQSYNNTLTKNEDQTQYLMQLVSRHNKIISNSYKGSSVKFTYKTINPEDLEDRTMLRLPSRSWTHCYWQMFALLSWNALL